MVDGMTGVSKVKCLLKTSGPGSRSYKIKRSLDVLNDYFHNLAWILCRQTKRCRQWGQDPMTVGEVEQSDEEPPHHEPKRPGRDAFLVQGIFIRPYRSISRHPSKSNANWGRRG